MESEFGGDRTNNPFIGDGVVGGGNRIGAVVSTGVAEIPLAHLTNPRTGEPGLFVSVRTFSQELKDTYYDSRSFQNTDFLSERDRMAPLQKAPCLVLDDLDRLDTDSRVVRSVAQLLDQRYAEEKPTVLTASRWAGTLQSMENYAFARLDDPSLLHRLAQSFRVQLKPLLERLMESGRG